jgi:hypothetical protein
MILMKQNVRKRMFEFERTKQKSEENNTFENWGKLELKTPRREEHFCENPCKLSEKARKQWKFFYGASSLFIGARGVVSRKLPRYDRCENSGGRMSTPTFWGWRFYQNSRVFVESDRRSQPASPRGECWGIRQKPYTLEMSGLPKFVR